MTSQAKGQSTWLTTLCRQDECNLSSKPDSNCLKLLIINFQVKSEWFIVKGEGRLFANYHLYWPIL